jgi:hypothetical protein
MKTFENVLYEDLRVYRKSLAENKLDLGNILANRLNSDAISLNSKEYSLISMILKECVLILLRITDPEKQQKETKLLLTLIEKIKTPLSVNNYMKMYSDFYKRMNKYLITPEEKYTEDIEFTEYTINYYLDFLITELKGEDLNVTTTRIFVGVFSEITRVVKTHGFSQKHLLLQLILSCFNRLYDYFRFVKLNTSEKQYIRFEKLLKTNLNLLINNIKLYKQSTQQQYLQSSLNDIFDISKEWRLMYVRFMDIRIPIPSVKQRNIELPEETREILKDMALKGVQSEIRGEE